MSPPLVRLEADDLPLLQDLLRRADLPYQDCGEPGQVFYGMFVADRLVAAGGLETAGEFGLLRSVVVTEASRGGGLARRITEFLITRARSEVHAALYLLTETADRYFERFGFESIPRNAVPPALAATRQFADLCPQSAACMRLNLGTRGL